MISILLVQYFRIFVSLTLVAGISCSCSENYAIVIDAGSTGSRCFLFKVSFDAQGRRDIASKKVRKIYPGLSTYVDHPSDALDYIAPLLIEAKRSIPNSCYNATTVVIKGTAGMRLIPKETQEAIWLNLYTGLPQVDGVPFAVDRENLGTINGHDEAYYAVLASNYIEGTIDGDLNPIDETKLVGALDMGGGSTQLIFYTHTGGKEKVKDEHFWSHSWLNFGVERIKDRTFEYLVSKYIDSAETSDQVAVIIERFDRHGHKLAPGSTANDYVEVKHLEISNPCGFFGQREIIDDRTVLVGSGDGQTCQKLIEQVIWSNAADKSCVAGSACPIDNIVHPNVNQHQFYAMSVYFFAFDCLQTLGEEKIPNW